MQKHSWLLGFAICLIFGLASICAFGQNSFWADSGSYYVNTDKYNETAFLNLTRDGRYLILFGEQWEKDPFLYKYNFQTGEKLFTMPCNFDYIEGEPGICISSDQKTYGQARIENPPGYWTQEIDLYIDLFEIETDTIITSIRIDSIVTSTDQSTPRFFNVQIDYSSSDSLLFVSFRNLQGRTSLGAQCYNDQGYMYRIQLARDPATGELKESSRSDFDADFFVHSPDFERFMLYNYDLNSYVYFDPYDPDDATLNGYTTVSQSLCNKKLELKKNIFKFYLSASDSKNVYMLNADSIRFINATTSRDGSRIAYSTEDSRLFWSDFDSQETRKDSIRFGYPVSKCYFADNADYLVLFSNYYYLLFDTRSKQVIDTIDIYPISKVSNRDRYNNSPIVFDDSGWVFMPSRSKMYKFRIPYFDSRPEVDSVFASRHFILENDTVRFTAYTNKDFELIVWDFGDGENSSSNRLNHVYTKAGTYYPSCIIYRNGEAKTLQFKTPIVVKPSMHTDFSCTPTQGFIPLTVQFTNESIGEGSTFTWDFGDGAKSQETNPVHVYRMPGTYSPRLTALSPDSLLQYKQKDNLISVQRKAVSSIGLSCEYINFDGRCSWAHRSEDGNIYSKIFSPDTFTTGNAKKELVTIACKTFLADTTKLLKYTLSQPGSVLMPFGSIGKYIYYISSDSVNTFGEVLSQRLSEFNAETKQVRTSVIDLFGLYLFQYIVPTADQSINVGAAAETDRYLASNFFDKTGYLAFQEIFQLRPYFMETPYMDCSAGSKVRVVACPWDSVSVVTVYATDGTKLCRNEIKRGNNSRFFSIASNDKDLHFIAGRNDTTGFGYVAAIDENGEVISCDSAQGFRVQRIVYMENDLFAVVGSMDGLMAVGFVGPNGRISHITKLNDRPGHLLFAEYEGGGKLLVSGYLNEATERSYIAELLPDFNILPVENNHILNQNFSVEILPNPVATTPKLRLYGSASGSAVSVSVFDVLGNIVFETEIPNSSVGSIHSLPVELSEGVYMVLARQGSKSCVEKFIKD